MRQVYLDYNATTPVRPEVVQAMLPLFNETFANPASPHKPGRLAEVARIRGSRQISNLINAAPSEIIITSGGTESDNLAIIGAANHAVAKNKKQIITTSVEHSASYESCRHLEATGFDVFYLKVDRSGMIDLDELKSTISDQTALVSIILANNETGTIQDYQAIKKIMDRHDVPLHYDAVQALGKMPLDVEELGVDLMSMSSHKIFGPKSIGALYVRRNTGMAPIMFGGGPKLRPGTGDPAAITGFGQSCKIAGDKLDETMRKCSEVRDYFEEKIKALPYETKFNGNLDSRVCNTSNVSFIGQYASTLSEMFDERGIAVSTGAACSTKDSKSRVLTAMGLPPLELYGALRFSFSADTTKDDIDYTIKQLSEILKSTTNSGSESKILSL